jgi:hypothetical protein
VVIATNRDNRLIFLGFLATRRILCVRGLSTATSKGDAAVLADRNDTRHSARSVEFYPLNDNELKGDPPTLHELLYLRRGLSQAGGKLPLFDLDGQEIDRAVVRRCLERGWAEPWFHNPLKPDWLVCKLTPAGRQTAAAA